MKFALISIKPEYVRAIIEGKKKYELRRRRPNLKRGDQLIIYQTSPEKRITAIAQVDTIIENDIKLLWQKVKDSAAISYESYMNYFEGCQTGYALKLSKIRMFEDPPSLDDLRLRMPEYTPPQFFHYLNEDHPLFPFLTIINKVIYV